jgi:hypothetical protein
LRKISLLLAAHPVSTPAFAAADDIRASLRGSREAMVQQNNVAKQHGLKFHRTPAEITASVRSGDLVELAGNDDYEVADFVQWPYLVPEARLFVERLSSQYRETCGQRLVVTSAVRPSAQQPRNSHALSVHPAGMAIDLRVSDRPACRQFLETAILNLERRGVLNGIREVNPPHYHIALFPSQYMEYAKDRIAAEEAALAEDEAARRAEEEAAALERMSPRVLATMTALSQERTATAAAEAATSTWRQILRSVILPLPLRLAVGLLLPV